MWARRKENITRRRESANTMISIGPRWVGERARIGRYSEYRTTTGGTYILMRTIWQRRSAYRSLNLISLCILFGNVAMYQNYIYNVIVKYVVLIHPMSLKKSFITLTKLLYIGAYIFDPSLVFYWTILYAFLKKCDGRDET